MLYKDNIKQKEAKAKHYRDNRLKYVDSCKKSRAKRRIVLYKLKSCGCKICGEKHPSCLDFHHINPLDKKFTIGNNVDQVSIKVLIEEAKKCIIICANCHRKLHWKEKHLDNPDGIF